MTTSNLARYIHNAANCRRWAKRIYATHGDCQQVWAYLFWAEEYISMARGEL